MTQTYEQTRKQYNEYIARHQELHKKYGHIDILERVFIPEIVKFTDEFDKFVKQHPELRKK